jgi:hypothetical protein
MFEAITDSTQSAVDMALRFLSEGFRRISEAFRGEQ